MRRNNGKLFTQVISFKIFLKEYCVGNPESDTLAGKCGGIEEKEEGAEVGPNGKMGLYWRRFTHGEEYEEELW